jgi:hypothetical protein
VVYMSCHGLVDVRGRLYFAATDTRKDRLAATGVESQWLLDQLEECRARRQVAILDCCFSGAFNQRGKGHDDHGLGERLLGHGRGLAVLTASRSYEYSFEGEPLPGAVLPGSVFTNALVDGIRTGAADADQDGYISVDDAYLYASERVRADGAAQTPQRSLYAAEGRILLARSPAGITIEPAALPESVRSGLYNPHPNIRLGAIETLSEWLTETDPARVLAARQELKLVADSDIPLVARMARTHLEAGSTTEGAPNTGAAIQDTPEVVSAADLASTARRESIPSKLTPTAASAATSFPPQPQAQPPAGAVVPDQDLVKQLLDQMELKYVVDDEGDLAAPWEEFRTYFMFRGEQEEQVFSVRTFYDRPHRIKDRPKVRNAIDDWNRRTLWPKVYTHLHEEDAPPTIRLIGETQMLIGTGVSLEHFASSMVSWVRAAIEFDAWLVEQLGL